MTMIAEQSRLPDQDRARELNRAIDQTARGRGFSVVRVPAPARRAEVLLRLNPAEDASYWCEPGGYEHVAIGAHRVVAAQGAERFSRVTESARRLFADLDDAPGVRLFGGFAFQSGRAGSELWTPFGEARFVLPRFWFERTGDTAELAMVLSTRDREEGDARARFIWEALAILDTLALAPEEPESAAARVELRERPDSEFADLVLRIGTAIDRGELEKLVLARRVEVSLARPLDATRLLRRLGAIAPECTRYAFRTEGVTFLGATPERLVLKSGMSFETEAVAGSIRIADAPLRLMESQKERAEQAIVVREVVRTLEPLAERIDHLPVPEIHRLRHIAHLRTPIRGTLREPLHVLDLVERLHPTPAVGGVPRDRALPWIAQHEPDERGWYAGPIGWFDGQGDGQFAVALRSGVFQGTRGLLYAGAGIVHGSDAASEFAETRWKLAALLGALEVVT